MERWSRHRYAILAPFLVLALITLVGGILNGATARGRLIDDYTDVGVKDGVLSVGQRKAWSGEDGAYVFENVPRTAPIRVDAPGYLVVRTVPSHGGDVRLAPLSITIQVDVEGSEPVERVTTAQIRQETRILGQVNASGNTVISPHPGRDAKLIVCAQGFQTKEVVARGVLMTVALVKDAAGDCPPLPTPTPDPNAPSPSPSPAASPAVPPAASPSPSPTGR